MVVYQMISEMMVVYPRGYLNIVNRYRLISSQRLNLT